MWNWTLTNGTGIDCDVTMYLALSFNKSFIRWVRPLEYCDLNYWTSTRSCRGQYIQRPNEVFIETRPEADNNVQGIPKELEVKLPSKMALQDTTAILPSNVVESCTSPRTSLSIRCRKCDGLNDGERFCFFHGVNKQRLYALVKGICEFHPKLCGQFEDFRGQTLCGEVAFRVGTRQKQFYSLNAFPGDWTSLQPFSNLLRVIVMSAALQSLNPTDLSRLWIWHFREESRLSTFDNREGRNEDTSNGTVTGHTLMLLHSLRG